MSEKIDELKPSSLSEFARSFLNSIGDEICEQNAKYDTALNREVIDYAFALMRQMVQRAKDVDDPKPSSVVFQLG